jgi:hypothetical protein
MTLRPRLTTGLPFQYLVLLYEFLTKMQVFKRKNSLLTRNWSNKKASSMPDEAFLLPDLLFSRLLKQGVATLDQTPHILT